MIHLEDKEYLQLIADLAEAKKKIEALEDQLIDEIKDSTRFLLHVAESIGEMRKQVKSKLMLKVSG